MTKEELQYCFDQWFDEIRNYITYRCSDPELATDLVQEAFIKVWEKGFDFQEEKTKSLLYKIASESWISQYRKQNTEKKYAIQFSFKDSSNDTEEQLYYEELKGKYESALEKLPEKRRTVFLMNRMEQVSYPEIANRLGISIKAVEKRMSLAIKQLKSVLQPSDYNVQNS